MLCLLFLQWMTVTKRCVLRPVSSLCDWWIREWVNEYESCSVVSDSFATPWTVARQAPLSMEFPRQENWSRLPFPSPGDLPNPGVKPKSPALQVNSLLSDPPGKPTFTIVGSLYLLQGFFPAQELNWGLLHCTQILYQLTYQGSPHKHATSSLSFHLL